MSQVVKLITPEKNLNLTINLEKDGQVEELLVLFIGKTQDQFQLSTTSHHHARHTQSNTMVRGVLLDSSQATVDGMIKIDKDAQHTNAFLEQKILLLSPKARATAEPMLEIEANEVKASHAATVGKLDSEKLFYLQSRGLTKTQATKTLVSGFLRPVLDKITDPSQKTTIEKQVAKLLE
jgi:Fe-S cluster assembly protein SufD